MHRSLTLLVLLIGCAASSRAQACGSSFLFLDDSPETQQMRETYITRYRDQGPAGLQLATAEYERVCHAKWSMEQDAHARWQDALDQIAAQRGAATSKLYWYTDLEKAKAAAMESGKPILSLRMLGKLTDEYSCANSRFFRTTLYANTEVSDALRTRFILHWQSVRPVPKVTIDFGDGRVLNRTLTGNSAHYLLTPQGQPLDVLPGLYSPQAFGEWLDRVELLANDYSRTHVPQLISILQRYHESREQAIFSAWQQDLAAVESSNANRPPAPQAPRFPAAAAAAPRATSKYIVEAPVLEVVAKTSMPAQPDAIDGAAVSVAKMAVAGPALRQILRDPERLDAATSDPLWRKIAARHREETKLDESSVAVIRQEHEDPREAQRRAMSKRRIEDPIIRLVSEFENSIALDTIKNEYQLHLRIHQWFAAGTAPQNFDALNEKVYAELFLTPSSDPWLGLAPQNVYTALEAAGKSSSAVREK